MATSDFDGDVEYAPFGAGESCSVVNDIKPVAVSRRRERMPLLVSRVAAPAE